jgi:hypothetical protein
MATNRIGRRATDERLLEGGGGGSGSGRSGGGGSGNGSAPPPPPPPPGGGVNTGRRMSDRELTQTGSRNSRAVTQEGLTNKNDSLPALRANVIRDQISDIRIMTGSGKNPTTSALTAASRNAAEQRAMNRTGGRVGYVAGAAGIGYGAGSIYNAVTGEDEKPTSKQPAPKENKKEKSSSDERVNKEDYPVYKKDTESAKTFQQAFKEAKKEDKNSFSFEGRKYNTKEDNKESKKMNRGGMVASYAKGGYVNQGIGASMKPHNVFGSKGKK